MMIPIFDNEEEKVIFNRNLRDYKRYKIRNVCLKIRCFFLECIIKLFEIRNSFYNRFFYER